MRWTPAIFCLALLALIFGVSTLCRAEDNALRQLEAIGSYDAALRNSDAQSQPGTDYVQGLRAKADQLTHDYRMQQDTNRLYAIVILSTLALLSLFIVLRFLTAKPHYSASHIVNATGLIFIIFGTILIVLMAQTDQHLTASVGILGAVAGYLFRSMQPGEDQAREGRQ